MLLNQKKILVVLVLISSLVNFNHVFASSDPVTTEDVAGTLSDVINQDKKTITKLIKSNKRLIKNIKGLSPKEKAEVVKTVNDLDNSIEKGIEPNTIENTLDDSLNNI